MNSRERIRKVLKERSQADYIPWAFLFGATQALNPTLLKNYKKARGIEGCIYDYLDYDVINVNAPENTGADFLAGSIPLLPNGINLADYYDVEKLPKGYLSAWGVYTVPWEVDSTFETFINPLKHADDLKAFENYPAPTVDEAGLADVAAQAAEIKARDKMSSIYCGSLYEWCGVIRGQEEFMIDLYEDPMYVEVLVEKVSELTKEMCLAAVRSGVDVICCYDDFGCQNALQISPALWRKFIKPGWKKVWDAVHAANPDAIIFLHSCGHIEPIIPDLIEIGLDTLHPIQPETMDVYKVCEKYQKDVSIWGTVSCQQTMPFGTPKDVFAEVRERMERLGEKGGFFLSPANILGPEVPLENVDAFIEAARACGGR